jgi:hypothetical protein
MHFRYTKEGGATRASGNSIFDRQNYVLPLDLFLLQFCNVALYFALGHLTELQTLEECNIKNLHSGECVNSYLKLVQGNS